MMKNVMRINLDQIKGCLFTRNESYACRPLRDRVGMPADGWTALSGKEIPAGMEGEALLLQARNALKRDHVVVFESTRREIVRVSGKIFITCCDDHMKDRGVYRHVEGRGYDMDPHHQWDDPEWAGHTTTRLKKTGEKWTLTIHPRKALKEVGRVQSDLTPLFINQVIVKVPDVDYADPKTKVDLRIYLDLRTVEWFGCFGQRIRVEVKGNRFWWTSKKKFIEAVNSTEMVKKAKGMIADGLAL